MRITKKVLSVLLGISMLAVPVLSALPACAEESLSSLQQQLDELENQSKEYQKILDETQKNISEKEEYSEALVSKINVLDDKIELMHHSIEELNADIEEKQIAIDKANEDIDAQVATLCQRLRTIYMAGSASDLEIIFGAKDFSDFLDKMQLIKTLSDYDKKLINEINVQLDEINEQITALEADKSELETQETNLESDQGDLNELLEENQDVLMNLYAAGDDAKRSIESAALQSEEVENQIKAYYEAQAAAKAAEEAAVAQATEITTPSTGGSNAAANEPDYTDEPDEPDVPDTTPSPVPSGSGYTWPCPGYYYLSSEWNEDRGSYNHGAIDITGSGIMGAQVVAADSGTVMYCNNSCTHNWPKQSGGSCGCGGGYGNYVMIDHGNGKMTIYAHLSSVSVSTGQYVSKGQTLGYVGTTGESTGAHLHFECRLNGVKYNPMIEF